MNKHYAIYKISETVGCVFEDGSDTRKTSTHFVLISNEDENSFLENEADNYGCQDYSYSYNSVKICELWAEELEAMKELFKNLKEV